MAQIHAIHRNRWALASALLVPAVVVWAAGCSGLTEGQPPTVWPGNVTAASTPQNVTTQNVTTQNVTTQNVTTQNVTTPMMPPATVTSHKTELASPAPPVSSAASVKATVRGQGWDANENAAGSGDYLRRPMAVSGGAYDAVQQASFQAPPVPNEPPPGYLPPAPGAVPVGPPAAGGPTSTRATVTDNSQWISAPYLNSGGQGYLPPTQQMPGTAVPLDIVVEEARTGRFMFGAGINSDAGVTGQITIDERNFNLFGIPTSWSQVWNGEAFRGKGQAFRLEAIPGNRVQRYLVSFTEPYLFWTPISLNVSGFLYDRGFYDWSESRAGGRLGLGYRLTPDLSVSGAVRMEEVKITNPRVLGVEQLDRVLGSNDFFSGQFSVRHDTRDLPFSPTEGHLIELTYEQAFGDFDYPRAEFDFRKYFMVRERPDGSGRHTIATSLTAGFSGSDTPLFENYFAGGFSTIRGFEFRGASPIVNSVVVGGRCQLLGSVEYTMPLTADDMIKGVAFCDFGTVEQDISIDAENFRVAPGFGFRISVPALGPAPLAFDFAFPVAKAETDDEQIFSFFFGIGRG